MRGLIVYDEERLKKNSFFAQSLQFAFASRGVEAEVVTKPQKADFAVMRTVNADFNRYFDDNGIRTFNSSGVAGICNDKYETYRFLRHSGVPCVPTFLSPSGLKFPFVAKSRGGHGGSEVYLIACESELKRVVSMTDVIFQPVTGERGKDMRVYVMGGKIITAMLRYSDSDFRANYSLGGSFCEKELGEREQNMALDVARALQADFVGVDMFFTKDGTVVNEVEDVVGCRMLYGKTDIYSTYGDYILKTLEK